MVESPVGWLLEPEQLFFDDFGPRALSGSRECGYRCLMSNGKLSLRRLALVPKLAELAHAEIQHGSTAKVGSGSIHR